MQPGKPITSSPEGSARLGQVFTPTGIADLIAGLCIHRPDVTVFDPCAGEGALLLAAGRRLASLGARDWHRQLRGLEVDPEVLARGRAHLAAAAHSDDLALHQGDFLDFRFSIFDFRSDPLAAGPATPQPALFAGPPAPEPPASTDLDFRSAALAAGPATPQPALFAGPLAPEPAGTAEVAREPLRTEDEAPGSRQAAGEQKSKIENRKSKIESVDVALMNPPYARQEWLSGEQKRSAGAGGRAGLYVHFWMRLAECVREGGWLGAITPGTWLSADFGRGLQAFLLERFRIRLLITFDRDVFPDANVEACIAVLERCADAGSRAATPVRFVKLLSGGEPRAAVAEALAREDAGDLAGCRLRVVPQADLARGGRWSRFFAAPACCGRVAAAAGTVPLEALVHLRRGITTGSNRVFLPDEETVARLGLEERFLRPMLRSPREIAGLDTGAVERPARLLVPPGPEDAGSRAAAYLRAQGISGSPYLRGDLPAPAPLLFGYAVRARKAFFRNTAGLLAGDNFHCLTPRREEHLPVLFALLNAAPVALLLEMAGRGQGRGLLKIQRYELALVPVADPGRLDPGLRRDLEALGEAILLSPSDADLRAALDGAAARALGLDAQEIRRAERELVEERLAQRECAAW